MTTTLQQVVDAYRYRLLVSPCDVLSQDGEGFLTTIWYDESGLIALGAPPQSGTTFSARYFVNGSGVPVSPRHETNPCGYMNPHLELALSQIRDCMPEARSAT